MFNLGFSEITLIAVLALILFGPDKMPDFARTVARFLREFRRMSNELRSTVHETVSSIDSDAPRPPSLKEVYERIDPRRAIEEMGIRPFADPPPGAVLAPPAISSADAPAVAGVAMAPPAPKFAEPDAEGQPTNAPLEVPPPVEASSISQTSFEPSTPSGQVENLEASVDKA